MEIIFDIAEVSGLSKCENSAIEDKFWRGKKKQDEAAFDNPFTEEVFNMALF